MQVRLRPLALPSAWPAGTLLLHLGVDAFQNRLQDQIKIEQRGAGRREGGVFRN